MRLIRNFALLALLAASGCDSTFEPLEESAWVYSIAGHLDPSVDTQWVRVNELRPVIGTTETPLDVVVTLEEMETGRTSTMNASLATYRPILEGGDSQFAFNFWTADPIRPGYTYRLTATRSDGASSSATASIPTDDFIVTYAVWVGDSRSFLDQVRVEGVPDLAMVMLRYQMAENCPTPFFLDYQRLLIDPPIGENPHISQLDWDARPSFLPPVPSCLVLGQRIVVAASGDPWPFVASTALRDLMHPNMVGNVENGTGYLAGLLLKSYPREGCTLRLPLQDFCEVRYTPTSASLEGTVLDACSTSPVQGAQVHLEEVTGNRIRTTVTDMAGHYRIEGLEPETSYRLVVSHPVYTSYESASLTFADSENRENTPVLLIFSQGSAC